MSSSIIVSAKSSPILRYCISCENESRPVQACDRKFFGNLKAIVGEIPVIVVFTKFDKVIRAVYEDMRDDDLDPTAEEIRESAMAKYKKTWEAKWAEIIPEGFGAKTVLMANPETEKSRKRREGRFRSSRKYDCRVV